MFTLGCGCQCDVDGGPIVKVNLFCEVHGDDEHHAGTFTVGGQTFRYDAPSDAVYPAYVAAFAAATRTS